MPDEPPWWHEEHSHSNAEQGDAIGTAAQEAARLFTALRDRVMSDPSTMRAGMAILDGLGQLRGGTSGAAPGDAPECAYCPVCQAIAAAQRINPESMERLTGAAIEFAEVVRATIVEDPEAGDTGLRSVPLDDDDEPDAASPDSAARDVAGEDT